VLEQAAMRSEGQAIDAAEVEDVLRASGVQPAAAELHAPALAISMNSDLLRPLSEQVAQLESRAIAAAMVAQAGNKAAVAKLLGISRATLYARLESA
jgi:DNA-binding NtrC family response regulator